MKNRLERLFPNEKLQLTTWQFCFLFACMAIPLMGITIAVHQTLIDWNIEVHFFKNVDAITGLGLIVGVLGLVFALWQIQISVSTNENSNKNLIKQEIIDKIQEIFDKIKEYKAATFHEIDEAKAQIEKIDREHRDTELNVAEYRGVIELLHKKLTFMEGQLAETSAAVKFSTEINFFKKQVSDLQDSLAHVNSKCIQTNHCADKVCKIKLGE